MPEVEIPEVGTVVFPDTMSMDDIHRASADLHSRRLTYGPSPVDFMGEAARAAAPVFQANRRQAMQDEMQSARRTQERADLAANIFDTASDVLRPFASTPVNPLGAFGSAARPVGAALNAVGDEAVRMSTRVADSYGVEMGPVSRDVVRATPGIAAAMAGGPLMRAAGVPAELAPAAAFGAVPFAQTLDATGDTFAASKAGLTGAAIPGVAEAGRAAAAKTLGALVERGIIGTGASAAGNMGQKAVEALGAQGALQVFMEGMNLPEYAAMTPEERKGALLHNLAVNSAFLMMDVPGVFSRGASQTRQGMKPAAKVGELMETLVNDPAFVEQLTAAADKFALEQTNPRYAQLEAPPVEFANVEPQLIDPSLPRPTMGNEQRVVEDYVEPAPTETVVRAEDFVQRPAVTIEPPKAPAAETTESAKIGSKSVDAAPEPNADAVRVGTLATQADVDLAAGRTPGIEGKAEPIPPRPPEPVPQKPAKGTKPKNMAGQVRPERPVPTKAPEFESLHPRAKEKFETAWAAQDAAAMKELLHLGNKGLRTEFERRMGLSLPKTASGTRMAVDSWARGGAKPAEAPAAAVEKVQEHVADVAAGEKQATPEPAGRPFTAATPVQGTKVSGHYDLVEAPALVTSFDAGYEAALQPRDRTRAASANQIADIVLKFDPNRLGESPTTDLGAPMVDELGQVLSGNGRSTALRSLYDAGKGDVYKDWLLANAKQYGIDPAVVQAMERPVLVRRVSDYGAVNKVEFARQSNQQQILGMGEAEKAGADAKLLANNPEIFNLFSPSEDGNVLAASNREFLNAFIKGTGDGAELLSAEGYNIGALTKRVKNAILGSYLGTGDQRLLSAVIESAGDLGIKSVVDGVMASAPALVRFKGTAYDVTENIHQALKDLVSLKSTGTKLDDFLGQSDLMGSPLRTAQSDALLKFFYETKSIKQVNETLQSYARQAKEALADSQSGGLFGESAATRIDILNRIYGKSESPFEGKANQPAPEPAQPPAAEAKRPENEVAPVSAPEAAAPVAPPKAPAPLRPLSKAENQELAELVLKKRGERDRGGPSLDQAEVRRYNELTARAGQANLLADQGDNGTAGRVKLLREKAAEMERLRKLTQDRFYDADNRDTKNRLRQEMEQYTKAVKEAMEAADALEAGARSKTEDAGDMFGGINTGNLGELGMGGAKPTEFTAGAGTPTSIKNATVDAERAKRGLPPAMEAGRRTWGEVWDRAMAVIDQDPTAQSTLIAQLKAKPRALTDIEDALLLHRQVDLQNQYGRLTRELAAAYDDAQAFPGRLEAVERLKVLVQETSNQLFELYEVGKAAGTETGRGLAARKMLADEHFELAQMETDLRAAKEGAALTDAERAKLTEAHDTIKRLQTELDAATARAEEARAERRAAEATEDLKQAAKADPEYNPVVIKLAERIVETLERRGKAAEERLKAKFARTSAGVDPTILADVIEIGAGRIARKALPFAEWADGMLKEFGDAVKDYLEPAWAKIGERMDRVATDIAGRKKGEALKKMRVLDEGQRRQKLIDSIGEAAGEDRPLDEIGTYVRRLALQFVKDGISDRNALVDAVHSVLVNHFDPDITRREAMDAISGYGDFKPLDPDPAKRTLRDLKGQLQSVAKLEDIEARRPLLKTGVERRAPSDEERRLIQQVNEAKRVHGVVTTDPARQLKSAQDGILTRLKHQIADLNFQIEAGERTVKSAAKVASTPEIDGLRIERDALKKRLDEMLPRPGISEAQRLAMAERALEADLALYEAKIAARDTGPLRAKSARLHSEKLEQLRARRDVLKAELDELRAAANPKLTPEERALRTLKRRLATEYAKTMDRIARRDFTPRRRVKEPFMDAEAAKLKGELDKAKAEWRKALVAEKLKNRSGWEKGWDAAKEVTHAQRQFWTSMDFSAVLRQGGGLALAHPGRALASMPAMFRALSETQANAEWAKVQGRPNWSRYQRAKLYLSDPHETTITKLEEQVRSRWLQNVPGIKQSNQTYTTFLNKLRADSFDAMVSALERKGTTLTDAELQGIANYINISTGRGDFGKLAGAADTLAMAFFSPRLLLSRFQYILGQPLAKAGSWRVGRQIAAEYARTLSGFGVVLALGALAGAEIETDERSSDFLKLKIGNTRIDIGAGLLQPLVYLARTVHGETKTAGGEVKPIRGNVPFGSQNWWDVTGNFARGKFSPSMGTTVDLLTGKNVVGENVTLGTAARDYALPLSFREVGEIMRQHGVPEGTTLMLLGLFGAGVSTRKNDERARAVVGELMKRIRGGTPEQREAIRERLMNSLTK